MIHHPLFSDRARLLSAATGRRRMWDLSLRRTISIDGDHDVILEYHVNTKGCVDAATPHAAMRREANVALSRCAALPSIRAIRQRRRISWGAVRWLP
jgi:hypothetical protein